MTKTKDTEDAAVSIAADESAAKRKPSRKELLKHLRSFRGRLPTDFTFEQDEANRR